VADEVNVYPAEPVLTRALELRAGGGPKVSVHLAWMFDDWPADPGGELARLRERGIDRVFVAIGSMDPLARVRELAVLSTQR
jgi:hypothetical protein